MLEECFSLFLNVPMHHTYKRDFIQKFANELLIGLTSGSIDTSKLRLAINAIENNE